MGFGHEVEAAFELLYKNGERTPIIPEATRRARARKVMSNLARFKLNLNAPIPETSG